MATESGYFYLNAGNAWPSVTPGPGIMVSGGMLGLESVGSSFAPAGVFLAGPFQVSDLPTAWFRFQARMADGSAPTSVAHVQFFSFVSAGPAPSWNPSAGNPFTATGWKAAPRDALDFAITNPPGLKLYIGGILRGDGTSTPLLEQARVNYGRDTYARFLPPVYRKQPAAADFLDRFLSIEQSVLESIEQEIDDLPRLFDPAAAPAGDPPSWLGWLSGGLTFLLDEHWTESEARQNLAGAFDLYGERGTIEGLRRYLRIYAGVNAVIQEPAREAAIWSLGDAGLLGFSTMLAPGPLQGAVLDTSATVDRSHLTTGEDFGAALFEDVAHRFCVQVYCAELTTPGALDTVRAVLDREKPAHTTYDLCVIEPAMRVGVQALLGIDTIVAAGPPPAGTGFALGSRTLAGKSEVCAT